MTRAAPGARLVIVAAALLLTWRVIETNAVVYEDTNQPVIRVPADGPGRIPALVAEIDANPANVGALLGLGIARDGAGEPEAAARAFSAALAIAPIDRSALRVAAALDSRHGRLDEAVRKLDRLLTMYPDTRATIFPQLEAWLPSAEPRAALEALAAAPSPWVGAFITFACGRADPRLVAGLLVRRAAAGLAQPGEVGCVTERLRAAGRWPEAYHVWLNTLPRARLAEVGYVFNGGFEHLPSGVGFDWIMDDRSPAHRFEFPSAPGMAGGRALRVSWTGKRAAGPAVRQFMALPPGRYELTGQARLEGLESVRGIQWALRCAAEPRGAALGASPRFLGSGEWERFAFAAEVPASCAGQVLQLEPAGLHEGTTYVSGKAWFDELRLARVD